MRIKQLLILVFMIPNLGFSKIIKRADARYFNISAGPYFSYFSNNQLGDDIIGYTLSAKTDYLIGFELSNQYKLINTHISLGILTNSYIADYEFFIPTHEDDNYILRQHNVTVPSYFVALAISKTIFSYKKIQINPKIGILTSIRSAAGLYFIGTCTTYYQNGDSATSNFYAGHDIYNLRNKVYNQFNLNPFLQTSFIYKINNKIHISINPFVYTNIKLLDNNYNSFSTYNFSYGFILGLGLSINR